jgi:hypothetical protein
MTIAQGGRLCEDVKMANKVMIDKILPFKLGYFHKEYQDHFLGR